jgi:hypothetical protein
MLLQIKRVALSRMQFRTIGMTSKRWPQHAQCASAIATQQQLRRALEHGADRRRTVRSAVFPG